MPFDTHNLRPKRIALFSGNYNYVMDGPVRALNTLVGFLESQGIEVLVFAPTAKQAAFEHKGTLVSIPSVALPGSRSEYRLGLGLPRRVKRQLAAFQPDLVHLAAPDLLGWSALRWAKKHKVPAVASFHTRFDTYGRYYHLGWLEKYVTALMRKFYHRCEQVYVPSECMKTILTEQNMAPDLRIWSRGVDTSQFHPGRRDMAWRRENGISDDEVVIAFVGRLVLEKGLGVFADTLAELNRRDVRYRALIVGDGPERKHFAEQLPQAVFTGYLQGDDLARAYASSDIFFNASITETFGNVTLEAMASAVPAVCADATGSRSLVVSGQNGYLVEPGNITAFADKLELLIQDGALRAQMSRTCLDMSQDRTWDAVLNRLLENYGEAVTNYPERAWQGQERQDLSAAE